MARGLENYTDIIAPDSDYPNGRIKDDTGSEDGTPVDEQVYGDAHQFLAKILREAGITPNGLPENEYSGHQYFEALLKIIDISAWQGGSSIVLFSSVSFAGCSLFDSSLIYRIVGRTVEFKMQLQLEVTNATLLNISGNVNFEGDLTFNTGFDCILNSDEITENGYCLHNSGSENFGLATLTYDNDEVTVRGLIVDRVVANADIIKVNINGSYPLA